MLEDLEDRDRLRDLLGGELQRAHLPVNGGEAAVDGLELAFDLADAVCEQRPSSREPTARWTDPAAMRAIVVDSDGPERPTSVAACSARAAPHTVKAPLTAPDTSSMRVVWHWCRRGLRSAHPPPGRRQPAS